MAGNNKVIIAFHHDGWPRSRELALNIRSMLGNIAHFARKDAARYSEAMTQIFKRVTDARAQVKRQNGGVYEEGAAAVVAADEPAELAA